MVVHNYTHLFQLDVWYYSNRNITLMYLEKILLYMKHLFYNWSKMLESLMVVMRSSTKSLGRVEMASCQLVSTHCHVHLASFVLFTCRNMHNCGYIYYDLCLLEVLTRLKFSQYCYSFHLEILT
jgi:hypothetical protein